MKNLQKANRRKIAKVLSALLKNPKLPYRIYEGIADGINETFNDCQTNSITESPEYIEGVLKGRKGDRQRKK